MKARFKHILFHRRKNTIGGIILIVIAEIIWGTTIVLNVVALDHFPAYLYAAIKTLAGGLILLFFAIPKWKKFKKRHLLQLSISSVIGMGFFLMFLYKGMEQTNGITTSVILALSPIVIYLFSIEQLKERFDSKILIGSLVSLSGVLLIIFTSDTAATRAGGTGALLVFAAIICDAFGLTIKKPLLEIYHPFQISAVNILIASVVLIIASIATGDILLIGSAGRVGWEALALNVVTAMVIAYMLYYTALTRLTLERSSVFAYIVPITGVLASIVFLGDRPSPVFEVGSMIVFAGLIISQVKLPHSIHLDKRFKI
ncbi:EamA family transporter [Candidatus Saccharibacteria bacterium]|jgi:drug/metabolite transporter (DMT)-like permease|nr:EamA family transporter [Candidatus Saccharibacteria bacterium]